MRLSGTLSTSTPSRLLIVVLLFVLAGCTGTDGTSDAAASEDGGSEAGGSAGGSVAATVGETEITNARVDELFTQRAEAPDVASELAGDDTAAVEEELRRAVLTNLIRREILQRAAEDQGIEVTDEDIAQEREQLVEELGGQEELDQLLEENNVSEDDLELELRDQAIQTKLAAQLSDDVSESDVRTAFEEDPQNAYGMMVEVRHILTETRAEARDAIERIEGGEDFAEVARDVSTDPGSAQQGGDLGEVARGQTVPPFEEAAFGAEEGEIVGPVRSEFGFHVIEVTDTIPAPSFEDVEGEIRSQLEQAAGGQAFNEYITGFVDELSVDVAEQYGRWDAGSFSVVSSAQPERPEFPPPPSSEQPVPSEAPTG